jgi:epoxyqueuosine reductase
MRIVLHACCGPCLLEPFDALSIDGSEIVVVYANPNIHPVDEYERRRDTLRSYTEAQEIQVAEIEYDPCAWLEEVGPHSTDRKERCRACYRLRLGLVARWAAAHGFEALATTLTVSPYQDFEAIAEEGERAASSVGIHYVDRDFRDRYQLATKRSRETGMYRQNYCGCIISQVEAGEERASRKAARKSEEG